MAIFQDPVTGEQIGRSAGVEYRFPKAQGRTVHYLEEEIKVCESFFEQVTEVLFAAEQEFKGVRYPFLFVQGTKEFRRNFFLEHEPRQTLVIFLRDKTFKEHFLDFIDRIVPEYQNRIGQARKIILVSPNPDITDKVNQFRQERPETRIIIPFSYQNLLFGGPKESVFRNFHDRYQGIDLFGYKDALIDDWDFVGRTAEIQKLYDLYMAGRNNGLFGLRKTGKTSVLYALMRHMKVKGQYAFYLDCNRPSIHNKNWLELLIYIGKLILTEVNHVAEIRDLPPLHEGHYLFDNANADVVLEQLLRDAIRITGEERFLLIFDEIENITYGLPAAPPHWRGENGAQDFRQFWQVIRAITQHHPDLLSYLLTGVNPRILEIQFVGNADNPIVSGDSDAIYLEYFSSAEVKEMITRISMLMQVRFSDDMYDLLTVEYGGHPFLIRQVCSKLVDEAQKQAVSQIDSIFFRDIKEQIILGLGSAIDMITDSLRVNYSDEYRLLDTLASGDHERFRQIMASPTHIFHLTKYGLIKPNGDRFQITIPAIKERLLATSRIFRESNHGGREKIQTLDARYSGLLQDLIRVTRKNGDYAVQRTAIEAEWHQWETVFGNKADILIHLIRIGEYSSTNYKKSDSVTGKEYYDISDDEYRLYLVAFDWIRGRLNAVENRVQDSADTQCLGIAKISPEKLNVGGGNETKQTLEISYLIQPTTPAKFPDPDETEIKEIPKSMFRSKKRRKNRRIDYNASIQNSTPLVSEPTKEAPITLKSPSHSRIAKTLLFIFISIPESVGHFFLDLAGRSQTVASSTYTVLGYILMIVFVLILWGALDITSVTIWFTGWWRFFFPVK